MTDEDEEDEQMSAITGPGYWKFVVADGYFRWVRTGRPLEDPEPEAAKRVAQLMIKSTRRSLVGKAAARIAEDLVHKAIAYAQMRVDQNLLCVINGVRWSFESLDKKANNIILKKLVDKCRRNLENPDLSAAVAQSLKDDNNVAKALLERKRRRPNKR